MIGNSSGAVVALRLVIRHPDLIRTLISYEPPLAKGLPDHAQLQKQHQEIYDIYRRSGIPPALSQLAKLTKANQSITLGLIDFRKPFLFCNTLYWFERELLTYTEAHFDVQEELWPLKDKLMFAVGVESPRMAYQFRANVLMAEKLGMELVYLPGEHNGHVLNASQFSKELLEALKAKDEFNLKL